MSIFGRSSYKNLDKRVNVIINYINAHYEVIDANILKLSVVMIQSSIKLIKTREYIPRAANLTEILLLKKWVLDLVDKKIVELEQEKNNLT